MTSSNIIDTQKNSLSVPSQERTERKEFLCATLVVHTHIDIDQDLYLSSREIVFPSRRFMACAAHYKANNYLSA
jgi:hypothetical protein